MRQGASARWVTCLRSRHGAWSGCREREIEADDRRVAFVGIEAYEAAGGTVIRDLFDEDGGYLADAALLTRLVRDKLQRVAEPVLAEGWKWVEVTPEFDYECASAMSGIETIPRELSDEEQTQLAALQERLETLSAEVEQDDPSEDTLAEIDRLEGAMAAFTEETYSPTEIARAGAFVALGHDGQARIERGWCGGDGGSGC